MKIKTIKEDLVMGKFNSEKIKRINELRELGCSIPMISEIMEIPENSVRYYVIEINRRRVL